MFCPNCGAQLPDGSKFCASCGSAVESAPAETEILTPAETPASVPVEETVVLSVDTPAPVQETPVVPQHQPYAEYAPQTVSAPVMTAEPAPVKKKNKGLLIGVIVAAVAIVTAVVLFLVLGGGGGSSSPEAVAEKAISCTFEGDIDGLFSCVNDKYLDVMCEKEGVSLDEIKSQMSEAMSYITTLGIDYKIVNNGATEVDSSTYDSVVEEYAGYDISVTDVKRVNLEVTMTVFGMEQSQDFPIITVKIGGNWYVGDMDNIGF